MSARRFAACQHFSTLSPAGFARQHFSFFRFGLARLRTRNYWSAPSLVVAHRDDLLKC